MIKQAIYKKAVVELIQLSFAQAVAVIRIQI